MNFILRKLIPGYGEDGDISVRSRCGKTLGFVGLLANLLLFIMKLVCGIITGSVAVTADAVNNLTDCTSSLVTLVGFRLAEKPADEEHPYGHARIEYITGILVSVIVLFLGLQLALNSSERIISLEDTEFSIPVLVILAVSILIKLFLFGLYRAAGKGIDSQTLTATGRDALNDVISTSVIIIGAVVTMIWGVNLDGWMGLFVAVFIIISGVKLIIETGNPLLGTAPKPELVKTICETILSYDGIIGVHDLQIHSYGAGKCFASVHCEVPAETDILISHDLIDNIEFDFAEKLGINLVIHLDPVETQNERTIQLSGKVSEIIKGLYPEFKIHDFRVVWGVTHTNIVFDIAVPFAAGVSDQEIRRALTDKIAELDDSYHLIIHIDRTSKANMEYDKYFS